MGSGLNTRAHDLSSYLHIHMHLKRRTAFPRTARSSEGNMQLRQLECQNKNTQAVVLGDIYHSASNKNISGKKEIFNKVKNGRPGEIHAFSLLQNLFGAISLSRYHTVHVLEV